MFITTSPKDKNTKKVKLPIITERFLTVLLKVISSKTEMTQREMSNIKKLLDIIDRKYYEEYDTSLAALLKAVEIITDFKIRNTELENLSDSILIEIQSELASPFYQDTLENVIVPVLKDSKNKKFDYDAEFINDEIYTYLLYNKIIGNREDIVNVTNNISTSSGQDLRDELNIFRTMLNTFVDYYREVDLWEAQNTIIHSSEPTFFNELKKSYDKSKNPSYVLKTGLQMLNSSLSTRNGLLPGYYLFYANINSFKSGLLEHFCRWIYLYNVETFRRIKRKTGKKPVILFVSLENSKQDDLERFVKMYTTKDIQNFTNYDDLKQAWNDSIERCSGVKIEEMNDLVDIAYYYPVNSVTVEDIKKVCMQLQDQNYTVMTVIIDYLEKIKAMLEDLKRNSDFYLGKISERLHELSKFLDCPVITAHQINRAGASELFNAKDSGKQNAVNALNSTYIGKDWDIEKPAEFSGFIDIEKDPVTDKSFLQFKKQKQRGKRTKIETFAHEITDGIIIEDDIKLPKPLSRLALTSADNEKLEFHISNSNVSTRGKTGVIVKTINKEGSEIPTKKVKSFSFAEAAGNILGATLKIGSEFLTYKQYSDNMITLDTINKNNIIKNENNKTNYIKINNIITKENIILQKSKLKFS